MTRKIILALAIALASSAPALSQGANTDSIRQARMLAGQNQLEGQLFMKENGKRPEVRTTYSGLQFEIMKMGESKKSPSAYKNVIVNYTAKFTNGEIFDQGQNAKFHLKEVIPGFSEGLQHMTIGSRFILYIPPELGYGTRGFGNIPPSKTLVFDVELLDIK